MSDYVKLWVLSLQRQGVSLVYCRMSCAWGWNQVVEARNMSISVAICWRGTIARKPGLGFSSKISPQVQQIIDEVMHEGDETTATQLQARLAGHVIYISLATITRSTCRHELGWIYRGSAYCQLTHEANKLKRLEFACPHLHDTFDNVIWSNETTVQLKMHQCQCYRNEGEMLHLKPR